MTDPVIPEQSTPNKIGWWILMGIALLAIVNHFALIIVIPGEEVLFIGWTAASIYAAVVLFIPYRQGHRWAWYSTWIFVFTFASLILFDAELGMLYLTAAGLMAVGQLLTRSVFFPSN